MKPDINVTPLIDVLLVLLIIFMVISPLTPAQFEAKIPEEPSGVQGDPHPLTLVVTIKSDSTLELNNEGGLGTIQSPKILSLRLKEIFARRFEEGAINEDLEKNNNLTVAEKIQKTVFIKAPKSITYGEVVRVIDEVKLVGANPISLQIDDLE